MHARYQSTCLCACVCVCVVLINSTHLFSASKVLCTGKNMHPRKTHRPRARETIRALRITAGGVARMHESNTDRTSQNLQKPFWRRFSAFVLPSPTHFLCSQPFFRPAPKSCDHCVEAVARRAHYRNDIPVVAGSELSTRRPPVVFMDRVQVASDGVIGLRGSLIHS